MDFAFMAKHVPMYWEAAKLTLSLAFWGILCSLILGFAWLLRMLGCTLLTPVRSSRDARLTLVIRACGDAPELEQLLRGIRWLRESGTLMADILLIDCGLTDDAAALCERAARRCEDLKLCNTEEICQWMQTSIQ